MARRRSARRQAERITEGLDAPHYIGKITPEAARAYIFSILNTKPAFRTKVWTKNWKKVLNSYVEKL